MSDAPLGKMIIEMGLDDSNFAKGVTGVSKQLSALKNDLKTSQTSFSAFGHGVDGIKSPMEVLTKTIEAQKRQLDLLKKSYDGSLVDGKASSSTQKYAADISRASAQMAKFKAELKSAAEEQYRQTSLLPKMSEGFGKVSGGLNSIASASAPASLAVTAVFAKGVQAAANFNGKMTEIRALLSDGTPTNILSKQIDTLSSKSKEWAQQYGIDTSSINDGMEEMIKRGYDFNQTVGAMPSVLNAAKASGDDFGTVMSSTTSTLEQFGLKTDDTTSMLKNTERVTDSLTFVANKTSAGFEDMGTAMEYVGPVAHSLNISLEQASSAIGLLSNNGLEGEKAGTALRGALSRLLKPTKQSSAAFEELGVNLSDFKKGNLDLPTMIDDIKKSTEGMTAAEKSSLITKAFGVEAQTGMNILVAQGGDALRNLTKETQNATGYTKKLADQMNDSDKNAFNKAKATLEVLTIDLGEKLLPSIIPVVKEIDNLAGSFEKLDPKTQQLIIKMGIAAAAVAPTAKALSGLTGMVSGLTGVLGKIGAKGAGKLALAGITTEATTAAGAVGGAGGLTAELGGIAPILAGISPIAVTALGTAGLAGLIIGVLHQVSKLEEKHNVFGTIDVPDETYNKVKNFEGKVEDLKNATEKFGVIGPKAFNDVKQAISDMGSATDGDIDKATQQLIKDAKVLGWSDAQINDLKNRGKQAKAVVKASTDDMNAIYYNAAKNNRKITADENSKVIADQKVIAGQELDALKVTGSKKIAVMKALNGDMSNMSVDTANSVSDSLRKLMDSENDDYSQKMASAKRMFEANRMSSQEYNDTTEAYTEQHKQIMKKYGVDLAATQQVIIDSMQKGTQTYGAYMRSQSTIFANYGLDFQDMLKKAGSGSKKFSNELGDSSKMLAQYSKTMSEDIKKADDTWNGMVLDPKTGKITTNAAQVVADTLKQKGGWEQIQFVMKHANLSTNAKASILEAVIASGQWDKLSPEDKKLFIGNKEGLLAIAESKQSLDTWNSLPASTKNLLGNDKDFMSKKENVTNALNSWNSMPENVKKLLGNDSDFQNKKGAAASALKAWNSMEAPTKELFANNADVLSKKLGAANAISQWNSLSTKEKELLAKNLTGDGVSKAQKAIDSLPKEKNTTLTTTHKNIFQDIIEKIIKNATGTPYHPGGLAMVNDQKGSVYKELITLPDGASFIPEGRDVVMPLPRGTSILKASETAKLIPKYEKGTTGVPADAQIFKDMRNIKQSLVVSNQVIDNSSQTEILNKILKAMLENGTNIDVIKAIKQLMNRPVQANFDLNSLTKKITQQQSVNQTMENILSGRKN